MTDIKECNSINSKTISTKTEFDESLLDDFRESITITKTQSGRTYIESPSIDMSERIYHLLKENDCKVKIDTYALFFRSSDSLTVEEAEAMFNDMLDINIVYLRVDSNTHTGKLVVDTYGDYQALKDFKDEDEDEQVIQFYHFDPKAKSKKKFRYKSQKTEPSDDDSSDHNNA